MSGQREDGQEKNLKASEQKLRKAREKGDIPITTELNTALFYIGACLAILVFGVGVARGVLTLLSGMFEYPELVVASFLDGKQSQLAGYIFGKLGVIMFGFFALPALFIMISLSAQRAVVFSPSKIKPKLSNLSVVANAKKKYGTGGLGEFLKSFAKLMLITGIAAFYLKAEFEILPVYSGLSASMLTGLLAQKALVLLSYVLIGAILIASIDLPAKILAHRKKMRMTHQEAKDERKESEGDPYQKQRRRQKAEEIAKTTVLQDVTTANVVIVNPEHYAVALKWDRGSGQAPICVAKGVDDMAFRIRERAKMAGVAIHENPPTARALFSQTKIGETIAPQHYAAVAAAIHYADQIAKRGF